MGQIWCFCWDVQQESLSPILLFPTAKEKKQLTPFFADGRPRNGESFSAIRNPPASTHKKSMRWPIRVIL